MTTDKEEQEERRQTVLNDARVRREHTGTEVSVGDRTFQDYVLPPGGTPGRPNWFFGPDFQGHGHYPLPWRNDTLYGAPY